LAEYTPESRAYELMVLLSPELGDEALESELQRISDQITGTGSEIVSVKSTTPWGRRRLAYPIQRHQDAFYVLYSLTSQPGQLDPFERELKLNSNVLRYLLVRQDEVEPEAEAEEVAESEAEIEAEEGVEESEVEEAEVAEETVAAENEEEAAPADEADEEEA
jgi:small subunit ribosomal protein S6